MGDPLSIDKAEKHQALRLVGHDEPAPFADAALPQLRRESQLLFTVLEEKVRQELLDPEFTSRLNPYFSPTPGRGEYGLASASYDTLAQTIEGYFRANSDQFVSPLSDRIDALPVQLRSFGEFVERLKAGPRDVEGSLRDSNGGNYKMIFDAVVELADTIPASLRLWKQEWGSTSH